MIPARFAFLDSLPLNPNGKVDRNALPAPLNEPASSDTAFASPQSGMETGLAKIWAELLQVEHVGIDDNFFRLGGHSLLALQVMARVRDTFKVDLPLKILFEFPTIRALAVALTRFSSQPSANSMRKIIRRNSEPSDHHVTPSLISNRENSGLTQDT
jgi:acyl carrier protein